MGPLVLLDPRETKAIKGNRDLVVGLAGTDQLARRDFPEPMAQLACRDPQDQLA
jgi:hypothetical protein